MKRLTLLITCCLFLVFALMAQEQKINKSDIIETYKGQPHYIHFVNSGETLSAIAKAYGVTTEEILNANLSITGGLQPNQVIKIPVKSPEQSAVKPTEEAPAAKPAEKPEVQSSGKQTHIVEPKETWYGLSRLFEVPVKDLISANPGVDTLKIGMQVNIPGKPATTPAITVTPATTVTPVTTATTETPVMHIITEKPTRAGYEIHEVQPQESLYSLSKTFNTTVEEIVRLNPELVGGLKTGQSIYIPVQGKQQAPAFMKPQKQDQPAYRQHVVERKETLYSISKKYNVDLNEIMKLNPGMAGKLRKGDILRIPPTKAVSENVVPEIKPVVATKEIIVAEKPSLKPCRPGAFRDKEFRIALLIPFQLDGAESIVTTDPQTIKLPADYKSLDFIQFYEGALLAVDSLKQAGLNCKVYVYDADAGDRVTLTRKILAKPEFSGMDLIIGPFFSESFELVADFAASHSIPIVNPLSQRSEIIKDNPYVFKAQPSNWAQYNETAHFITDQYTGSNVVLLRRTAGENTSMADVLKAAIAKYSAGSVKVKEVLYSQVHMAGLLKNLVPGKNNVIMVLVSNDALLPALLRDINEVREKYQITLFGLPEWESMEIDNAYLLNLNTHLFSPWFVDYSQPEVKQFVGKFRALYKTEPEESKLAFLGYDLSFYFASSLMNYGKDFTKCINSNDQKGLSAGLTFIKSEQGGYENAAATVYVLKDYKRQVVNR